MSIMQQCKK